jgi:acetyl-CoA C-acetyltransferase
MSKQPTPVILSAVRTPTGRFGGSFSTVPATQLGAYAIQAAVERAGADPAMIDEVFMGQVVQAGSGQAPARQAAIYAGLPPSVGAVTVNKICGSGLRTVMMAATSIKAGEGRLFVAGGMENMNMAPFMLGKARFGYRLGTGELLDATVHDGLTDPFHQHHMGVSAEWIAENYNVTRQDMDEFALASHQKAAAAIDAGYFDEEIVPIIVKQKRKEITISVDETVRRETKLEKLASLAPAFKKGGMVTAGNAPPISDGASALVVADSALANELGLRPLARILGYAYHALEPIALFTAPPFAVRKVLAKVGWSLEDVDLLELNEAFAAQAVHNIRELGVDPARVNVNGGAIALGHAVGSSGSRVLTTLLHALRQRDLQRGVAALCLGGGEAVAMAVEML